MKFRLGLNPLFLGARTSVTAALLMAGCGDDATATTLTATSTGTGGMDTDTEGTGTTRGSQTTSETTPTTDETTTSADTGTTSEATDGTDGTTTTATTGTPTDTDGTGSTGETTGGTTSGTTGGTTSGTTGGNQAIPCPAGEFDQTLPSTQFGNLVDQDNEFDPSCGPNGAPDIAFTFTAPATDSYTFDTFGSQQSTVVYVLDGECGGAELGCNYAGLPDGSSATSVDLVQDQTVTVVVDSFSLFDLGNIEVTATQGSVECPVSDLGNTVPQTINGSTAIAIDEFDPSCGGGTNSPDLGYLFAAPADGTFTFETTGSSFNTVLYLLDDVCGGNELVCNDNIPTGGTASGFAYTMTQGQQVTVVVDGAFGSFGDFTLHIDELPGTLECPNGDLGNTVPQTVTGSTAFASDEFDPSCGGGTASNDHAWTFTAPADGTYTFDTLGSSFNTVLYVLDGTCTGTELACNNDAESTVQSAVQVALTAGQQVTVVVDGSFGAGGSYELSVGQLGGTCPDEDLAMLAPPFDVMGDTTATGNTGVGSCAGLASPDYSYLWTAPASAMYLFDTAGSSFDTAVYVRDGACDGAELNCGADYAGSPQGRTIAELTAGQTVAIFVDGQGESGAFNLHVEEAMDAGDCCFSNGSPGCEVQEIETCVCVFDPFCCNVTWDGICAGGAVNSCGAVCP